ncbi:MAG: hypothetical protein COC07_03960, partial [Erythrobacteraceae bacterium]
MADISDIDALTPYARSLGIALESWEDGIPILSVPFEHTVGTLKSIREALAPDTVVVSMGVPLATAVGDVAARTIG